MATRILASLAGACLWLASSHALAAESYDNCAGFIDTLPATIDTQGVWCLRQNLATSIASGNAITIATNNVTIDCNDFKIGGLAAGDASEAIGISAIDRLNITIRNCNIRGFFQGIYLRGASGGGHRVVDNRLDQNLYSGITIEGDANLVQGNQVFDTGGSDLISFYGVGISARADVIDNTVDGVIATAQGAGGEAIGIDARGSGNEVRGNRIRNLVVALNNSSAKGIVANSAGMTIDRNRVYSPGYYPGTGISAPGDNSICTSNSVVGFTPGYFDCESSSGNVSL